MHSRLRASQGFIAWGRRISMRRMTAMCVLLCYGLGQGIIPIRVTLPVKLTDVPFPCQHHACGCASAAQCWKSCCCFTKEQKLAWAAANKVEVPEYLQESETQLAQQKSSDPPKKRSCCSGSGHHQACSLKTTEVKKTCCSSPQRKAKEKKGSDVVSITDLLGCRGLQLLWVVSPPTLPDLPELPELTLSRSFETCGWSDDVMVAADRSPPIPPPRLG